MMAGSVRDELWAWAGLCKKKKTYLLIPLSIFLAVWNESNVRVFEGIKREFVTIRDRWIHIFAFMVLGHDINRLDDFENVIDL